MAERWFSVRVPAPVEHPVLAGKVLLRRRGDARGEWGDPGSEYVLDREDAEALRDELTAALERLEVPRG